jgi:hypothetical protein
LVIHQEEMYDVPYVAMPDLKITNGTSAAGQRILALGGGIANDVWPLANNNLVVNADYSVAGLRVGPQNGVNGVAVNPNSGAVLPFQDRPFDIVVCNDILERLLEPLSVQFLEIPGLSPEKFYWDFGNLAHYYNPDRWIEPQLVKQAIGQPLSGRARLGIYIIRPFWRAFSAVVPRRVRSWIVSLCPGLFNAGFYVRWRKK